MGEAEDMSRSSIQEMIILLSSLLKRITESNDLKTQPPKKAANIISAFNGLSRPTISIQSYLERIFKYADCSPCCFILAFVYLHRFSQRQPLCPLNSFNTHRLLITTVLLAAKFMDDVYYDNAYYAKIGGISTTEMNFLEVDFLFGLGFHLNVSPNTFHDYCSYLQREMLMLNPPLNIVISDTNPSLIMSKSVKLIHSYLNEDEANSHQQQRHQQLTV